MGTSVIASRYERLPRQWVGRAIIETRAHVTVIRSVNADRNRIFQALTIAEYLDAWFVAPDMITGSTSVLMRTDSFLVGYNSSGGHRERFVGAYKVLRRGKVQFSWKRNSFDELTSSLVKIRLQGDFGRTTVHLIHVGLDETERSWYKALWEASLERLASLF